MKLVEDLTWIAKSQEIKKKSEIEKSKWKLLTKAEKLEKEKALDLKTWEKEKSFKEN